MNVSPCNFSGEVAVLLVNPNVWNRAHAEIPRCLLESVAFPIDDVDLLKDCVLVVFNYLIKLGTKRFASSSPIRKILQNDNLSRNEKILFFDLLAGRNDLYPVALR